MLTRINPVPAAPAAQVVLTPDRLRKLGDKGVATVLRQPPTSGRGQRYKITRLFSSCIIQQQSLSFGHCSRMILRPYGVFAAVMEFLRKLSLKWVKSCMSPGCSCCLRSLRSGCKGLRVLYYVLDDHCREALREQDCGLVIDSGRILLQRHCGEQNSLQFSDCGLAIDSGRTLMQRH